MCTLLYFTLLYFTLFYRATALTFIKSFWQNVGMYMYFCRYVWVSVFSYYYHNNFCFSVHFMFFFLPCDKFHFQALLLAFCVVCVCVCVCICILICNLSQSDCFVVWISINYMMSTSVQFEWHKWGKRPETEWITSATITYSLVCLDVYSGGIYFDIWLKLKYLLLAKQNNWLNKLYFLYNCSINRFLLRTAQQ